MVEPVGDLPPSPPAPEPPAPEPPAEPLPGPAAEPVVETDQVFLCELDCVVRVLACFVN